MLLPVQDKAIEARVERKRAAEEKAILQEARRISALQEAREAAAVAAQTRADLAAKTEEERQLRADTLKKVRQSLEPQFCRVCVCTCGRAHGSPAMRCVQTKEDRSNVKVSNGVTRTSDAAKSGAAERAAGRRKSGSGRRRSLEGRSSSRSRSRSKSPSSVSSSASRGGSSISVSLPKMATVSKAGKKLSKGLGKGLDKGVKEYKKQQKIKADTPWWESQSEGSQKAIMCEPRTCLPVTKE